MKAALVTHSLLQRIHANIIRRCLVAAMVFGWVVFAQAAEYSLAPYMQMQLTHDDNLALAVDEKESLAGGSVGFGVDFVRDDQINELTLNASVQSNQYNRDRYNIDNQQLGASYQRKFERALWRINVDGNTSSTRTSELEEGGSGQVDTEAVRVVSGAASSILSINMTEKSTLQWSLSGQYRDYDRETLRGYDAYSTALLLQRSLTQRFIMQFQLGLAEYQYLQNNDFPTGLDQQVFSPGLGFL
ncbi:hypothetical protein GYB62_03395, partial [bacterium]|nr:hypothetical protein [bacterium]